MLLFARTPMATRAVLEGVKGRLEQRAPLAITPCWLAPCTAADKASLALHCPGVLGSMAAVRLIGLPMGVFWELDFFLLRTAPRDHQPQPPTASRQPPTANRHQPWLSI